jgi:sulfur transfer complex TusBCD TusB component (DsrH family)
VNSQQDTVMHGLATDRTGALTAVYRGLDLDDEFGPVQFRDRPFGGPIGKVTTFPLFAQNVRLAVSPGGRQVLAYFVRRDDDSYALEVLSRRRAERAWSAEDVIARGIAEPFDLQLAIASSGEAVVLWQDGTTLAAAGRAAGSTSFEAPVTLGAVAVRGAALGMDAHGNALLAWAEGGDRIERAIRRPAGGAFGGIQALPVEGRQTVGDFAPELAVSATGRAVLAWHDLPEGSNARHFGASAAIGTTAQGFGAARSLDAGPVEGIDSAIDDRLTAVTWVREPGSTGRVVVALAGTGQPVEALTERVLSPRRSFSSYGSLTVARGRATVTWNRQVGTRGDGGGVFVVEARATGSGGSLGARQRLSERGACCGLLVASRRGRPFLAWRAGEGRIDVARASLRTGLFGAPVRIRARGFDTMDLVATRGDAMLLTYRSRSYHLLTYGEPSRP